MVVLLTCDLAGILLLSYLDQLESKVESQENVGYLIQSLSMAIKTQVSSFEMESEFATVDTLYEYNNLFPP